MNVVDAASALLRRLDHADAAAVAVIELPRVSRAALLQTFRSGVGLDNRVALIDAGKDEPAATVAFGVADTVESDGSAATAQRSLQTILARNDERVVLLAVPFTPSSSSSSSPRTVWVPRVWLRQGAVGPASLGVDVIDGDVAAAVHVLRMVIAGGDTAVVSAPSRSLARVDVPDRVGHAAAVDDVLATIARGEATKIVLARRTTLSASLRGTQVDEVLSGLLAREQRGTAYVFVDGDAAFFGCSPERLCVRRGRQLDVDALAGTAPRGATADDDDAFAKRLRADGKERREHGAVVDAIVMALRPLSTQLEVAEAADLVRLGHVQHLHTPVRAVLVDDAPVFAALHPTPAVAGTPRDVAIAAIARLEPFSRGLYAGFVGVADRWGEQLTVALRCGRAHDDVVDVYAGSGLVAGADAAREWLELERKAALVIDVVTAVVTAVVSGVGAGAGTGEVAAAAIGSRDG